MSREADCGPAEARSRARIARMYIEMAELAASETALDEAATVAAGNAVLAAIVAADSLSCLRLGCMNRSPDHDDAVELIRTIAPNGPALARDLARVLGVKDPAHDGVVFVAAGRLKQTMRAASRLVDAAEAALVG